MVVSCPPTRHPVLTGSTFEPGELIASEKDNEAEIASFIGLDSLHYLSLEGWCRPQASLGKTSAWPATPETIPSRLQESREVLFRGASGLTDATLRLNEGQPHV